MSREALLIFFAKKSYELCYAMFRMSSCVKRPACAGGSARHRKPDACSGVAGGPVFADRLEYHGIALFEAASAGDCAVAESEAGLLERLIALGSDIGLVNPANAQIIFAELRALNSAIAELKKNPAIADAANFEGVFSAELPNNAALSNTELHGARQKFATEHIGTNHESDKGDICGVEGNTDNNGGFTRIGDDIGNGLSKLITRRSAIVERIRQNGNCRLKEVQDIMPEVSERTLRYDVQNLLEQGIIERIGSGGPATYYRIAKSA